MRRIIFTSSTKTTLLFFLSFSFRQPTAGAATPVLPPSDSTISFGAGKIESIETSDNKRIIILEENVQIIFSGQHLSCDRAEIRQNEQTIIAEGRVSLTSATAYAEADRLVINYRTQLGSFENAFIQYGNVVFEGDLIEKTGESLYRIIDARYTACATCPPAWSFSGSEIEAEIGGYASIKYPVLSIAQIPVFILPRIWIPLSTKRQSGFLPPSIERSASSGWAPASSYFWAISRSQDLTATLKHYELRGWKELIEYRYKLAPNSGGELSAAHINDRSFANLAGRKETEHRMFLRYRHLWELPHSFVQRAQINFASDLSYPRDFPGELPGFGDPALENRVSLTHNSMNQHVSLEGAYYLNLLSSDPNADNSSAVHRLPEIRYALTERPLLGRWLYFHFEGNYVNFVRRGPTYDDIVDVAADRREVAPTRDGTFEPGQDLIRSGHRLWLQPTLSTPFHIGPILDIIPSLVYHESHYVFSPTPSPTNESAYSPTDSRRYAQVDLAAKTRLSRVFAAPVSDSSPYAAYRHEIEPEIVFTSLLWAQRPTHEFFGDFADLASARRDEPVNDQDIHGSSRLQFDYNDRLFDRQTVKLILTQSIVRKRVENNLAAYQKIVALKIDQSYDLNAAKDSPPRPLSPLNSTLDMRLERFDTSSKVSYYPYSQAVNSSLRFGYKLSPTSSIGMSFARAFTFREDDTYDFASRSESWGLNGGFQFSYFVWNGEFRYLPVTRDLSWEYSINFTAPGDCWGITIKHSRFPVTGDIVGAQFQFQFGGA